MVFARTLCLPDLSGNWVLDGSKGPNLWAGPEFRDNEKAGGCGLLAAREAKGTSAS
jgi:hypothetical protein